MFWKVSSMEADTPVEAFVPAGRYVVHRHVDSDGEHLDLRLEVDGHLRGWRIDGLDLSEPAWATEKAPHPLRWLEDDEGAQRVDAGEYMWARQGLDGGALILRGADGCKRVSIERAPELPVADARAIAETLWDLAVTPSEAAQLIEDGMTARKRASERLCGLGRELDGDAFEERVWRKALEGLSLDEVHQQLRAFETRFDAKYPPQPVSRPASEDDASGERSEAALAIVRE